MVCTSNDISQLPPELTRSGRFDGIWYFAMPDEEARAEIFSIHFSKYHIKVAKGISTLAASLTKNYTGAEIEEAVKVAVRKAFIAGTSVTEKIVTEAVREVIPIWKSSQEQITKLQDYCRGRYRFTDGSENNNKRRDYDVLSDFES